MHQGDVMMFEITGIPECWVKSEKTFFAKSEKSGHAHALCGDYELYTNPKQEGFIVKVEEISTKVFPSGSACAPISVPITPPAPGRFSINTFLFNLILSSVASARPTISLLPPGAKGTIIRIGFEELSLLGSTANEGGKRFTEKI